VKDTDIIAAIAPDAVSLMDKAIAEIKRLRQENATLTDEIELLRSTVTDCRIEIERLRAERDEIRRSYCSLMEAYRGGEGRVTANKLGWGYLFEEGKPCQ
jgi:chromosome segregation ATPase